MVTTLIDLSLRIIELVVLSSLQQYLPGVITGGIAFPPVDNLAMLYVLCHAGRKALKMAHRCAAAVSHMAGAKHVRHSAGRRQRKRRGTRSKRRPGCASASKRTRRQKRQS